MSMNLIFETKNGHLVDFPFQTPTDLTYEVLRYDNQYFQYCVLDHYVKERDSANFSHKEVMGQIEDMLFDHNLKLTMI